MSEKLTIHEHHENQERPQEDPERLLPTAEQAEPLRKGEQDPAKRLEEARDEVHEAGDETKHDDPMARLEQAEQRPAAATPGYVSRELRKAGVRRQLGSIRRSLSAPERTLSRVVHQPVVRAISEPAAKTVSRPSGILGGGLVAFLGTSGYLYLTKTSGMRYSYFAFIALFLGGFALGLILELLIHMTTRPARSRRQRADRS
jgi:hypothetical protein